MAVACSHHGDLAAGSVCHAAAHQHWRLGPARRGGGGAVSAKQALPSIGQLASEDGSGDGAEEKSDGSDTLVEVIKKM